MPTGRFRLFRILWYYKIPVIRRWLNFHPRNRFRNVETSVGGQYKSSIYIAMELMVQNLESLGKEMFTVAGNGGLLLMLIFLYTGKHIPHQCFVAAIPFYCLFLL